MIKIHSLKGFDQSACVTDLEPWDTIYVLDSPENVLFGVKTFLTAVCLKQHTPLRTARMHMRDNLRHISFQGIVYFIFFIIFLLYFN